jgi:valyl-tRNA synthetase
MDSRYDHLQHENSVYQLWEKHQAFKPEAVLQHRQDHGLTTTGKPFSIIMPPPNANDPLHIGHAMFIALEDILLRYHRQLGDESVWIPGTDHAGIETQFVFEKKLKKQDKSRFDFDRDTLYQMIWDYVQENSGVAVNQMKKLGASADWSRFKFTLDPDIIAVVLGTFFRLHQDELVYRDVRLVNYCPNCGTGFSELETKHVERPSQLHYLKYGPFTIATARIETKFRDTALAVNPRDPRYKEYLGKTLEIQGLLGPISMTVIADEEVDPEFGTGIMKVTPAHDPHDFELGKRYNLPVQPIITFQGRMDFSWYIESHQNPTTDQEKLYLERAQKYHGKKVNAARELMLEDLKADGLLVKTDANHVHNIATCYKCGSVLEPLPIPQFFIQVKPLVKKVQAALKAKKVKVHGAGHDKILDHWLKNLRDWNISRQIVWGIRLPVWYSTQLNPDLQVTFLTKDQELKTGQITNLLIDYPLLEIKAGLQQLQAPLDAKYEVSPTSPGDEYLQETDTFDTWFSSGQWPFATLKTTQDGDFDRFYPTSVMETGYDILPFWVMRMLLLGLYATDQVPFRDVYLHGLVRDQKGQKMSKSKGNVINPLDVIEKYGADALRLALVIRSTAGLDKSVGEPDIKAMRNFTNKIWNAARFVTLLQDQPSATADTSTADQAFITRLNQLVTTLTQQLNDLKIGLAAETVYNEFWHWYCDEAIEATKKGQLSPAVLLEGLETFLRLLHPFVPFVTEALWQHLVTTSLRSDQRFSTQLLCLSSWPTTK